MKILFITIDFPPDPGGVANYYNNICQHLKGAEILVLAEKKSGSEVFDQKQPYKIIREDLFLKNIWPKWIKMLYKTYKLIRREKPDFIFVGQVLPVGTVVYLLQKIFKFKYVVFTHGMDINIPLNYARKRMLMIKILQKADNVIANSHYTMKRLARLGIDEDKITVVFPCPGSRAENNITPVTLEHLKEQYNLSGKLVLLTIGRLVERKGIDNVIEALSYVKETYDNFMYLIIGKGPDKNRLHDLINKYNLSNNVKLVGFVSDNELPLFYQTCDIFIMTSREIQGDVEGFGMVYLEANSYGKPVIASRTGGVIEAVLDSQTGILVNQGDVEQIKNAIIKLVHDKNYAITLGENGRKRVEEKFQWQDQIKKLENIIK